MSIHDASMDMYWEKFYGRTSWPQMDEEKAGGAQLIDLPEQCAVSQAVFLGRLFCLLWESALGAESNIFDPLLPPKYFNYFTHFTML